MIMPRLFLAGLLLGALGQSAALQVGTPCTGVSRASAVRMAFPTIEDARTLSDEEIEQEIFNAKKVRALPRVHVSGSCGWERERACCAQRSNGPACHMSGAPLGREGDGSTGGATCEQSCSLRDARRSSPPRAATCPHAFARTGPCACALRFLPEHTSRTLPSPLHKRSRLAAHCHPL